MLSAVVGRRAHANPQIIMDQLADSGTDEKNKAASDQVVLIAQSENRNPIRDARPDHVKVRLSGAVDSVNVVNGCEVSG